MAGEEIEKPTESAGTKEQGLHVETSGQSIRSLEEIHQMHAEILRPTGKAAEEVDTLSDSLAVKACESPVAQSLELDLNGSPA
ncbi:unnamed protein product [Arabidopsis arenosa]|uniref:Uncharacterized protein n=1 Tax=Arabidopsis arenosa TaxID=38785 RepID=A0A8S2A0Y9_ARAAE|nr:unnamed protein product [Arabidopsis arenosa]